MINVWLLEHFLKLTMLICLLLQHTSTPSLAAAQGVGLCAECGALHL